MKDNVKKIIAAAKVIDKLQKDLESKYREIKEKDTIINIIKYNYKNWMKKINNSRFQK